jgi:uncharacterized peroxidase-related enzyme
MWRFTPIEVGPALQELQAISSKLHLGVSGVPRFLKLLAKSPAAMNAFVQAESALAVGQLASPQREAIALAVAEINGCNYCLSAHEGAARQAGLSDEEIWLARKASANNPKLEAMLRFVQAVVLQRGEVNDEDFSAMRKAGFSDSEIIEVLANVAVNIFANYFNIIAQTDLDRPGQQVHKAEPLQPMTLSGEPRPVALK